MSEAATLPMTQEQRDAIDRVLWLDQHVWADIAPSLTCTEAEAIADFLRTFGGTHIADVMIEMHALADEEDDMHYQGEAS